MASILESNGNQGTEMLYVYECQVCVDWILRNKKCLNAGLKWTQLFEFLCTSTAATDSVLESDGHIDFPHYGQRELTFDPIFL